MPTATATLSPTRTIYSYSRLSMFSDCHRQFYHKYVDRRPYPPNTPMVVGKVFHAAIEKVLAQGYSPDEAVFFAIAEANGLPQGERDYFIMSMVKRAYQRFKDVQNDYLDISSELHLVVETEAGLIQLFLDVVIDNPMVDELMIWDFKTSWHPFSAEDSKQLALYAYLFKTMRNGMVPTNYHGKLIFPRLKEDSDTHVVFTEEKLESARLWAVEAIWEIEKRDPDNIQDWEMTGDQKKCEFCPYVSLCAGGLFHGLPGDGTPKDADEAALIGQFILTQEMALKRMKEGIKKFSKKTGQPIVLNGGKLGLDQRRTQSQNSFRCDQNVC
jgi:hypothetical protein